MERDVASIALIKQTRSSTPVFPPFNPFVRHPTSTMGKLRMMCCFWFLVPIRLFCAIHTILVCFAWCKLCLLFFGKDVTETLKPYTPLQRALLWGGCSVFSRILLFFYGFVWIDVSYEVGDPILRQQQLRPSIIVVNHLGFAELLYLVWSDGCCFVSKDTNRELPLVGTIADCTGHCLLQFATGAFRCGKPIQPVVVKSLFSPTYGYDTSFSCTNIFTHVIGLMTQPMNRLEVKHLAVYTPSSEEKENPKLFAKNVQKKMAKKLDVKCYDLTWTDKLRFEPTRQSRDLARKKLLDRYGFVPPEPNFTVDAFGNPLKTAQRIYKDQ